ncbi:hypothetical protein HOP50_02g18630 [Chloropicon primus]|nr:hypothetical protein HOP50_02g18630 [Chloropicon primus]
MAVVEEAPKLGRRQSVKKSIVKFLKGSSTTKKGQEAKETLDKTVEVKSLDSKMTLDQAVAASPVKVVEPAPVVEEVATVEETATIAPLEKKEVDKKKLLFATAILGIATKIILDKASQGQKKKVVVVPAVPEYKTYCLGKEENAKKKGLPLVCLRVPKKMVFQFKNKELKMDLPSLFFKKF